VEIEQRGCVATDSGINNETVVVLIPVNVNPLASIVKQPQLILLDEIARWEVSRILYQELGGECALGLCD
jgi:hypothetical protein